MNEVKSGVRELKRGKVRLCRLTSHTNSHQRRKYRIREFKFKLTSGKKLKRDSESGRVNKTKFLQFHLFKTGYVNRTASDMQCILHTRRNNESILRKELR